MVIDKLSQVGKLPELKKVQQNKNLNVAKGLGADTVSISSEAMKAREMAQVQKIVKNTSDIRADKVKEAKAKLARGDYDNLDVEILDKVAEKIAQAFL